MQKAASKYLLRGHAFYNFLLILLLEDLLQISLYKLIKNRLHKPFKDNT